MPVGGNTLCEGHERGIEWAIIASAQLPVPIALDIRDVKPTNGDSFF